MANRRIEPHQLSDAIRQALSEYSDDVTKGVNAAAEASVKRLVSMTKATAPKGARGKFRRSITYAVESGPLGSKEYTWGAKAPEHRLTHLLVHGHATRNGGRTAGNSFLQSACDTVFPEFEHAVEEVIRNGG